MKNCTKCGESKALDSFRLVSSKTNRRKAQCRDCDILYDRIRYAKDKENQQQRARDYYHKNKDERVAYARSYYQKNSEEIKRKAIASYPKYKELRMANNRLRRASKLGNDYQPYTLDQVIERYGDVCYLCNGRIDMLAARKPGQDGWENGLHLDHVLDISAGGPDSLDNVRPTHGICNLKKPRKKRSS